MLNLHDIPANKVLGLVFEYITQVKSNERLTIIIKKYQPTRTLKQNAFEHLLYDYLGAVIGINPALVKEGIKQKYGPYKRVFDKLVPIPSHECDIEEMSKRIEGVFIEAGEQEPPVDMNEFIAEWRTIKEREQSKSHTNT